MHKEFLKNRNKTKTSNTCNILIFENEVSDAMLS